MATAKRRQIRCEARSIDLTSGQEWSFGSQQDMEWIAARAGKEQQVETVKGYLRQFLVEPFVPHPDGTEYYININSVRDVSCALAISLVLNVSACMKSKSEIGSVIQGHG